MRRGSRAVTQDGRAADEREDRPEAAAPAAVPEYLYDAFFSYASRVDAALVRDVEVYVEGLHQDPLVEPAFRRRLSACVDGSDFKRPWGARRDATQGEDPIFDLITGYMAKSRRLVVFTGPDTATHPWVERELAWWIRRRGAGDVTFALTHGGNPDVEPRPCFPASAVREGLHREIAFDLRGFKRVPGARPYEEERLRLAASLMGEGQSAGDIVQGWRRRAHEARRRSLMHAAAVTALVLVLVFVAWVLFQRWRTSAAEARTGLWATLGRGETLLDPDARLDALAYATAALAERPSPEAYQALVGTASLLPVLGASTTLDTHAIDAVAFIEQGRWLAAAGYRGELLLLDPVTLARTAVLKLAGRASAIERVDGRHQLAVLNRATGLELIAIGPGDPPELRIAGRARVAPAEASEASVANPMHLGLAVDVPGNRVFLASGSIVEVYRLSDARVDGWKPTGRTDVQDAEGDRFLIRGIVHDPLADTLVVADIKGEIACLKLGEWPHVFARTQHSTEVFGLAFDATTRRAVAADSSGGWFFLDAATCRITGRVEPPSSAAGLAWDSTGRLQGSATVDAARTGVAASPDGRLVGVSGHDGTVRVYAAASRTLVAFAPHPAATRHLAFSADGRRLVVAGDDGALRIWHLDDTVERLREAGVQLFAVDRERRRVAWLDTAGSVTTLDAVTGRRSAAPPGPDLKGATHLVSGGAGGAVAVWNAGSSRLAVLQDGRWFERDVAGAAALRDVVRHGSGWLVGRKDGSVSVIDDSGGVTALWKMEKAVTEVAANAEMVVALAEGGEVDLAGGDGRGPSRGRFPRATSVALGGRRLVVGVGRPDPAACVCEVTGSNTSSVPVATASDAACSAGAGMVRCVKVPTGGAVHRARFSPDGETLALSIQLDARPDAGEAWLLRRSLGWSVERLGQAGRVDALSFSENGRWLALGERRGISVWSVAALQRQVQLPTPSPVRELAFSGNGDELVALDGIDPGVLRIWDWRPEALVREACARWPLDHAVPERPGVPTPPARSRLCGSGES